MTENKSHNITKTEELIESDVRHVLNITYSKKLAENLKKR
jgi:hypothetical protein